MIHLNVENEVKSIQETLRSPQWRPFQIELILRYKALLDVQAQKKEQL